MPKFLKHTGRILGGLTLSGALLYSTNDEFYRTVNFWRTVFPIFITYKIVDRVYNYSIFNKINDLFLKLPIDSTIDRIPDREDIFNLLHDKFSPIIHHKCVAMRGFYLKSAQLLSVRSDFLPPQYLDWCVQMQHEVPVQFGPDRAKEILKSNEKLWASLIAINLEEPIGSASIGQVYEGYIRWPPITEDSVSALNFQSLTNLSPYEYNHIYSDKMDDMVREKLLESSTNESFVKVAIKIQAPSIERQFRSDLKSVKLFCKMAMPQFNASIDEIERQFLTEFNYIGEGMNMEMVKRNIDNIPYSRFDEDTIFGLLCSAFYSLFSNVEFDGLDLSFAKKMVVPKPYLELTTPNILVMDFLDGKTLFKKFDDFIESECHERGISKSEYIINEEKKSADKSTFNLSIEKKKKSRNSNSRFSRVLSKLYRLWDLITFKILCLVYSVRNLDSVLIGLRDLLHCFGYQIFINGSFNGDPHPGNFLFLKDGRIGLIDFGQVKVLDERFRQEFSKMAVACHHRDASLCAKIADKLGFKSKFMDENIRFNRLRFWLEGDDVVKETGNSNIHEFLEDMEEKDPAVSIHRDVVMVGRCSILLRSIGLKLGLKINTLDFWEPYARWVSENGERM